MKEATGELNMTVITVVAIAAVGAFFYAFVWLSIQNSLKQKQCANQCGGASATIDSNGNCSCDGSTNTSGGNDSAAVCDVTCCGVGFTGVDSSGNSITCTGYDSDRGYYRCTKAGKSSWCE